jgi:hypothetical protein
MIATVLMIVLTVGVILGVLGLIVLWVDGGRTL